jgi:hypothetical protein
MKFKDLINEETSSNEFGLSASGKVLYASIKKADNNNLVELNVQGKRTLIDIPSVETLQDEYNEEDADKLSKIWEKLAKDKSKDLEKAIKSFESDLEKIISSMEKELKKY